MLYSELATAVQKLHQYLSGESLTPDSEAGYYRDDFIAHVLMLIWAQMIKITFLVEAVFF